MDLLAKEEFKDIHFKEMILSAKNSYFIRNGIVELMKLVEEYNIPFFIISGGVYHIIEETLKLTLPNYTRLKEKNLLHILANKFTFDREGKVNGYEKESVVFTFNKSNVMKNAFKGHLQEHLKNIENVIVIGDHINVYKKVKLGFRYNK